LPLQNLSLLQLLLVLIGSSTYPIFSLKASDKGFLRRGETKVKQSGCFGGLDSFVQAAPFKERETCNTNSAQTNLSFFAVSL